MQKEPLNFVQRLLFDTGRKDLDSPKPFTTVDEQIGILKDRGVFFDQGGEDEAARFLLEKSYYTVINGYKDPFLDKEATNLAGDDRYRKGITFLHFTILYGFDTIMRSKMMDLLLQAETAMKTAVVYAFCDVHRGADAYLDPANYCSKVEYHDQKNYTRGLIKILSVLQGIRDNKHHKSYIRHHDENHHSLPLWVASKCLTFGNMASFFDFQQQSVKTRSCVALARSLEKDVVRQRDLVYAFRTLPGFRNVCAHNERLYCARVGRNSEKSFAELLRALSYVLPQDVLASFAESTLDTLDDIGEAIPDLLTEIMTGMGMSYDDLRKYVGTGERKQIRKWRRR